MNHKLEVVQALLLFEQGCKLKNESGRVACMSDSSPQAELIWEDTKRQITVSEFTHSDWYEIEPKVLYRPLLESEDGVIYDSGPWRRDKKIEIHNESVKLIGWQKIEVEH